MSINGTSRKSVNLTVPERHYLWRAVDHEGAVLEGYVTKRRDRRAALKFLKRTMKRYGRPGSIVTDHLPSYRAAMNGLGNVRRQRCGRWLNNRAENSHLPFRRREGAMARFRGCKDPAKVRIRPLLDLQPLQSPTQSQPTPHLQTTSGCRFGRVARTGSLKFIVKKFRRSYTSYSDRAVATVGSRAKGIARMALVADEPASAPAVLIRHSQSSRNDVTATVVAPCPSETGLPLFSSTSTSKVTHHVRGRSLQHFLVR